MRHVWILALSLSGGCAIMALASKGRSIPDLDGALDAPGAAAPIHISRDEYGVPHIRAASEADAIYAMGFVHAQDRLFQADLGRRAAFGELSEWLGERALGFDRFARSLRARSRSEATIAGLPAEERVLIEAYCRGMNDGVASLPALPLEYRLLGVNFEPWEPVDAIALVNTMSLALSENLTSETAALMLASEVDAATLSALLRYDPATPDVDAFWDVLRTREIGPFTDDFNDFTSIMGGAPESSAASNNWIVGPSRSASGSPIVANDPHLVQGVPSLWYSVELSGGDLHVAGASLPGVPGVIIGHNARVAWGLTNTMADTIDLAVLERPDPDHYILEGQRRSFEHLPVEIAVKRSDAVHSELLLTDVGPVIIDPSSPYVVAARWHALEIQDETVLAFLGLNRAGSVEEALEQTKRPMIISQNLLVADVDKDWAWQVIGSVVQRRQHTGRVPYPASEPGQGWAGYITDLPGERAPERGYVHTANTRPDHPSADAISTAFVPPHRCHRIQERLEVLHEATPADMTALQRDRVDQLAVETLPTLLEGVSTTTPASARCLALLQGWDHLSSPEATGATVWAVFQPELIRQVLQDQLSDRAIDIYLSTASPIRSLFSGGLQPFSDDLPADVDRALGTTCLRLERDYGASESGWAWGGVHPLKLAHPFGEKLGLFNMPEVPYGGSGSTVNAANFDWNHKEMAVGGMASLRIVMPLDDLDHATLVFPGGESGHPTLPDYSSQFQRFVDGETVPLWFSDADVDAHAVHRLTLAPAP